MLRKNQGQPDSNKYIAHCGKQQDKVPLLILALLPALTILPTPVPKSVLGKTGCSGSGLVTLCHAERESTCHVRFKLCLYLRAELTVNVLDYTLFSSHIHCDVGPAALRIRKVQQQSIPFMVNKCIYSKLIIVIIPTSAEPQIFISKKI